jgi:hypothetical protein
MRSGLRCGTERQRILAHPVRRWREFATAVDEDGTVEDMRLGWPRGAQGVGGEGGGCLSSLQSARREVDGGGPQQTGWTTVFHLPSTPWIGTPTPTTFLPFPVSAGLVDEAGVLEGGGGHAVESDMLTCMAVALAEPLEGACICGAAKAVSGSGAVRQYWSSWARFYRPAADDSLYWSPASLAGSRRRRRGRRWTRPRLLNGMGAPASARLRDQGGRRFGVVRQ